MATSLESSSPASLHHKEFPMGSVSPPMFSPSSDQRFWSTLRSRVDTLIENRHPATTNVTSKDDSMLLIRGFDSVSHSLSQLSSNLENALQGARNLAKPPTLTEIVQATLEKAKSEANNTEPKLENSDEIQEEECLDDNRGLKRKECDDDVETHSSDEKVLKMKKAKKLAIAMATKAATMARELKSIRSDLSFVQERCALLEEENRKLRDGISKGVLPEEDDLVRLQLEALLAEKSRLANENANVKRENECLHQLVEYHQLTSHDLSASYENLVRGMGLDFSDEIDDDDRVLRTPLADGLGFCKSLDECFDEEQHDC